MDDASKASAWRRGRGSVRATMLVVLYLAVRTRNAAADALDDVLGVSAVPESPPLSGQLPSWSGFAGVGVLGVVGVVGSVGAGAVVEGLSVCAEALNGFRTVSANAALAMPNAVMPVVTTFLIRCTLSLCGFTRASCASTCKAGMKPK